MNLEDLNREELLITIKKYNRYVQEFPEYHDEGSYPVSIFEYINNDLEVEE